MINHIHKILSEALARHSLDRRTCFTAVYPKPPGGRSLVFECSERVVSDEVRQRMSEGAEGQGGAVNYVVLPNGDASLPELFITNGSVADVRKEPTHTAELLTQTIYGETVAPLKQEGDWYLVRLDDHYVGWIRSWHLTASTRRRVEAYRSRAGFRVSANLIQVLDEPDDQALPVADAVVGIRLAATPSRKRGWRRVELPDGKTGFIRARGIERIPRMRRVSRDRLAATGMRFLGIPYLWGGTTPKGFDCSGLIQRIFQLGGVGIPRDSDMQSRFGRLKKGRSPEGLNTGDLLFFGKKDTHISHVAMYLSNGLFLHAYGQVKVGSMDPAHPLFEPTLSKDWRWTRDPLSA